MTTELPTIHQAWGLLAGAIKGNFSFWLLLLVVIMAATQLWLRGFAPEEGQPSYYDVPVRTRIVIGLLYFGLAAALFLGLSVAHSMLPPGSVS